MWVWEWEWVRLWVVGTNMPLRLMQFAGGAVAMQRARSLKSTNIFGAGGAGDYPAYEERTLHSPALVHNRTRCTIKAVVYPG